MGVAVNEVTRGLRVATVYKHTPAREAGIQPGEVITAVNGDPIAGKDADAVTARIRGPAGTKVTLTIESRDGKSRQVTLTRREVSIPQVVGHIETVNGVKVGYVRLAGFFPGAHGELRKEVESLYSQGAEGIVLDLRGNGGGLLTEAVLVSSIFVPDGVIVSTHGRTQRTRTFDGHGGRAAPPPDGRPDQRRHRLGLGDRHRRLGAVWDRDRDRDNLLRQGDLPGGDPPE